MQRLTTLKRRLVEGVRIGRWSVGRHPPIDSLAYHLRNVILRFGITTVIDVGAHHGEYGTLLRRDVRFSGVVHSFEPSSAAYAELAKCTGGDSGWHTWNVALGTEAGEQLLHQFDASELNSLREPTAASLDHHPGMRAAGAETVAVCRLDDFTDINLEPSERILLKVDVQGADLDVLRGAHGIMPTVWAVQVEAPMRGLYRGQPSFEEVLRFLRSAGFTPSGVFPVGRARDLGLVDVDVVAVRL
jgi:FkbM family methyltransferase